MSSKKVWLITGGSRGIGKCMVDEVKKSGDVVITCSRNSGDYLVDVADYDSCQKMIEDILNKYGRIDVLVNDAGIYGSIGKLEDNEISLWKQTMDINLMGTVNCTKLVLPIMKKQGWGKIINLAGAGVGGEKALKRFSAYYTSKMAVVGFTEVIAAEVGEDNIQVNCISPGGVNTYFTDLLIESGVNNAGEEAYNQALKQKESGGDSPLLAAKMTLFLASKEADHISGKIISAKWDKIEDLKKVDYVKNNLFNLRRIDNFKFYEK